MWCLVTVFYPVRSQRCRRKTASAKPFYNSPIHSLGQNPGVLNTSQSVPLPILSQGGLSFQHPSWRTGHVQPTVDINTGPVRKPRLREPICFPKWLSYGARCDLRESPDAVISASYQTPATFDLLECCEHFCV